MQYELGFEVRLALPIQESLDALIKRLPEEGFEVLSQIDLRSALNQSLGRDFKDLIILVTWNPRLAYRALCEDSANGLILPCNITIESDEQDGSIIRIVNPEAILTIGAGERNQQLRSIAREERARLERLAETLLVEL
jgi:uncharacterized protein (DUF302 family)